MLFGGDFALAGTCCKSLIDIKFLKNMHILNTCLICLAVTIDGYLEPEFVYDKNIFLCLITKG